MIKATEKDRRTIIVVENMERQDMEQAIRKNINVPKNIRLTAIKADTTDRADKGYILIGEGSRVEISCSDDALQATLAITVEEGAAVTGRCGGDMLNCPGVIQADAKAMQMRS